MSGPTQQSTQPGWYDDGHGIQRWWDGNGWTQHVAANYAQSTPAPRKGLSPFVWVGSIGGAIVLLIVIAVIIGGVVGASRNNLASRSDSSSSSSSADSDDDSSSATDTDVTDTTPDEPPSSPGDSIDNPAPLSTVITGTTSGGGSFELSFGPANLNASDVVAAENMFNDSATAGNVYAIAPIAIKNTGSVPFTPGFTVVSSLQLIVNGTAHAQESVVLPDSFVDTGYKDLAPGTSVTGNIAFQIPAGSTSAIWVLTAGGDSMFVSAQ